jgi:hypothetical protein
LIGGGNVVTGVHIEREGERERELSPLFRVHHNKMKRASVNKERQVIETETQSNKKTRGKMP